MYALPAFTRKFRDITGFERELSRIRRSKDSADGRTPKNELLIVIFHEKAVASKWVLQVL